MLSSWADLLPLTLSVAFYIGPVYSLALTSFLPTETVTLYTVSVSQASKSAIATDLPPSISTGLSALGTLTLSDGSSTTYLEEEVEFSTTIVSGDITTLAPQSTTTAILIEGASGYDLLESSSDSWRDVRCSFQSGSSASCVESAGFVSSSDISSTTTQVDNIALLTTSYLGPAVPFFTLTASTPESSSSTTPKPTSTTSITPTAGNNGASNSNLKKHSQRNLVGRAVGGSIGGGLFIAILVWLIFLLLRRNRHRKRPPSQQYMRSIPPISRELPPDVKDLNSPASTYTSLHAAPYAKPSSLRPWTTESAGSSTFKDDSITPTMISAPFIPPPPRTEIPEAPPAPERLPSTLRNRPSKFIEQLTVNSTDLDVLVAIAKAEAAQKQETSREQALNTFINSPSEADYELEPVLEHNDPPPPPLSPAPSLPSSLNAAESPSLQHNALPSHESGSELKPP